MRSLALLLLVLIGCSSATPKPRVLRTPKAKPIPAVLELCPDGVGVIEARSEGLWIDEVKSTCYANQLDYLDYRPQLEQETLDHFAVEAQAYADAVLARQKFEYSTTHVRRVWAYVLGAGAFVVGASIGAVLR